MANKGVGSQFSEFATTFFPCSKPRPPRDNNPFLELLDASTEPEVTAEFIKAVNDEKLAPGLTIKYCGDRPDHTILKDDKQRVDAAFYRNSLVPEDNATLWANQLVPVEFKRHTASRDPFEDTPDGGVFATETLDRKDVRAQIISYAELVFAVQQRLAVFTLVVMGTKCRFIRWDRSGSIVTRLLDYVVEWEFFCDVLWGLAQCSDEQLGLDPTAVRLFPGDADYELMEEASKSCPTDVDHTERLLKEGELPKEPFVFAYIRQQFAASLNNKWPRYRLEVPDGTCGTLTFLVCKPRFRAKGLAGRGTRGFIAYDPRLKRFVWIKDAWRAHYLLVDQEGTVLALLNEHHVPFVPTLVCHGDIQDQETLTPMWWNEQNKAESASAPSTAHSSSTTPSIAPSSLGLKRKRSVDDVEASDSARSADSGLAVCPLRLHRHYRIVEEEVALQLHEFQNGKQLLSIVKDCVQAHFFAETRAFIRHRDVSTGNVLIWPKVVQTEKGSALKWTGLLADWEMSKPTNFSAELRGPRQPQRTGTSQYMSVALLSRRKTVETCDELESFFYVILYCAVRYLKSNFLDGDSIANFIDLFFDHFGYANGVYTCGDKKVHAIHSGTLRIGEDEDLKFNSPIDKVLSTLLSWLKALTKVRKFERSQAKQASSESARVTLSTSSTRATSSSSSLKAVDNDMSALTRGVRVRPPRSEGAPTVEDRQDAAELDGHLPMFVCLDNAIETEQWDLDDKVGDQVPRTWIPNVVVAGETLGQDDSTTSKRAKHGEGAPTTESMPAPPVLFPLLPPRPAVTPPRKK